MQTVLFGEPRLFNGESRAPSCLTACRDCTHGLCVSDRRARHHPRLAAEHETVRSVLTSEGAEAGRNDPPLTHSE